MSALDVILDPGRIPTAVVPFKDSLGIGILRFYSGNPTAAEKNISCQFEHFGFLPMLLIVLLHKLLELFTMASAHIVFR